MKQLWRISNLTPCGNKPQAASAQFPALISHPALFILNIFHTGLQIASAAQIDPLYTFSPLRLTSRSLPHSFIGPLCSLISSSVPDSMALE